MGTPASLDLPPSSSCWQGQADINHLPREGTRHHLAPFNGPFSSGSLTGAEGGLIVFSWHLELAIVWLLMNFSAIRKPKGGRVTHT